MKKTTRPSLHTIGAFASTGGQEIPQRGEVATTRAGKKAVPFWVPTAAKRQLDYLTIEQDTTQQNLLTEALNLLFQKYGKPPIA